jgi:hypothetical protein
MTKLIQICASANDLFGLDGDGAVYQYNFNTKTWMDLGHGRSNRRELALDEGQKRAREGEAAGRDAARETLT